MRSVCGTFSYSESLHGLVVVLHEAPLLPGHHALRDAPVLGLTVHFLFGHLTKHPLRWREGGGREDGDGEGGRRERGRRERGRKEGERMRGRWRR